MKNNDNNFFENLKQNSKLNWTEIQRELQAQWGDVRTGLFSLEILWE